MLRSFHLSKVLKTFSNLGSQMLKAMFGTNSACFQTDSDSKIFHSHALINAQVNLTVKYGDR